MVSVVGLEKFSEEEDSVGFIGSEDSGLLCFFAHLLNLNLLKYEFIRK
jgi:hypothetical protein